MSSVETADFKKILQVLTESSVEFIIIGGVAATVHGSARLTKKYRFSASTNSWEITQTNELKESLAGFCRDFSRRHPEYPPGKLMRLLKRANPNGE